MGIIQYGSAGLFGLQVKLGKNVEHKFDIGGRLNRFCTLNQERERERVGDEVLLFWVNKHIGFAPKLAPLLFSLPSNKCHLCLTCTSINLFELPFEHLLRTKFNQRIREHIWLPVNDVFLFDNKPHN